MLLRLKKKEEESRKRQYSQLLYYKDHALGSFNRVFIKDISIIRDRRK